MGYSQRMSVSAIITHLVLQPCEGFRVHSLSVCSASKGPDCDALSPAAAVPTVWQSMAGSIAQDALREIAFLLNSFRLRKTSSLG